MLRKPGAFRRGVAASPTKEEVSPMQRLVALAIILAFIVVPSPSYEADSPSLGSFWMDPIKEFHSEDPFTLWFRSEEDGFVHFCLSREARWTKIGLLHLSDKQWVHYWTYSRKNAEVAFQGNLPTSVGEVTLVYVGHDLQRCGSQDVTIKILTGGE